MRDGSLIMGGGGLQNRGRGSGFTKRRGRGEGAVKYYAYKKGGEGGRHIFSHAEKKDGAQPV